MERLRVLEPRLEEINFYVAPDNKIIPFLDLKDVGRFAWPTLSDGALRYLALLYEIDLADRATEWLGGIRSPLVMIEEPENGIHPLAVETVYRSLSSVYNAQILLATHSPVILSLARADDVLCFAKTGDGATDIVRGSDHPALRQWKGTPNLGVLLGSGVLG